MIDLADLRLAKAIAGSDSLAAAARALNVTPSAVSQRLSVLEAKLKLRLVERGPGRFGLTAEGELLAAEAVRILADIDGLGSNLALRRGQVTGPLVVIAPFGFGRIHVAPLLGAFAARHPGIVPTLTLTDAPRKAMGNDAWDVLIHVGRLPDLDLTYRRLATNRRLLVASATYVRSRGLPADPRDLKQHTCGVVREDEADVSLWSLSQRGKAAQTIRVSPAFSSNDGEVVLQWVLSGMGIAERSEWSVSADLAAKRLVRVLPDWNLPDADIVAILNPRTVRTARAEALLQDLVAAFSGKEWN